MQEKVLDTFSSSHSLLSGFSKFKDLKMIIRGEIPNWDLLECEIDFFWESVVWDF